MGRQTYKVAIQRHPFCVSPFCVSPAAAYSEINLLLLGFDEIPLKGCLQIRLMSLLAG